MDLFRDDIHIAIQWETAADSKGKAQQGISKEWIRDITTYAQSGKMLFGWAISSILTEHPGAIKFSVRFYHFDEEGKIDFNLNTLPASAAINASIDYEIISTTESEVGTIVDSSNLIKNRLTDSVTPPGVTPAEPPVFIVNLPEGFKTDDNGVEYNSIDLNEEGAYVFEVQAISEEGSISYQWYRKAIGSEIEDSLNTEDGAKITYVSTDDTVYSGEYPYYKKETSAELGDVYTITTIDPDSIGSEIPEEVLTEGLYEKRSTYTTYATGDYRVEAINRMGVATERVDSTHVRIPGPDKESFKVEYPEGQEHSYLTGEVEGSVDLKATGSTKQDGDKITYVWSYKEDGTRLEEPKTIENGVEDVVTIGPIAEADRFLYDKTFIVTSYASRNGDQTSVETREFRVTDPAHPITVSPKESLIKLSEGEIKEIGVNIVVNVVSDDITYQWYKLTKDTEDNDFIIEGAITPVIKITSDPSLKAEDVFDNGSGSYYCKVTNHANNSIAETISEEISVIPY